MSDPPVPGWVDWALVTPDALEDLLRETLRRHHREHLAAHERRAGMAPGTLEPLRTIAHLSTAGDAQAGDAMPRLLLGWVGLAETPTENERGSLDIAHVFGFELAVNGTGRRDTLRRRDWMAWTAIECLMQRAPGSGPITGMRLRDVEALAETVSSRILGRVRALIDVQVHDALTVIGLPPDDEGWAPGLPGGGPPLEDPYAEPIPLPPASELGAIVERSGET